jgi:O-antigen/teichoic acid export membrane protein
MSGGRSGFIRQSLGVASSQYLARAVLLVRGLVAAAALGPVAFGAWNALTLILDYGSYASLGAIQGLDLVLPAAALRGEAAVARTTMAGAWWVTLVGGALFALAVIVHLASGSWLTLTGWGWSAPLLMLAAAFVQLAIQYHVSALRAHREFGAVSVALTLQAVVGGGLGMATVARAGVWGLLWSWLAGGTCALLWVRRDPRRPPLRPAHPDSGVKLALIGLPMFAFFALALMIRSFDRIALVRYGGNDALGVYSIGLIVAGMVFYVPEAAAAVLFPRVAAAAGGARDPEGTRAEVFMAQRALMAMLPLLVGIGLLWAPPIVARLLPAYVPGLRSMRVLVVAALAMSTATLPSYYLLGLGRARAMLPAAGMAAAVAAAAIFTAAALDPRPVTVAWGAAAGYGAFALAMLALAIPRLAPTRSQRWGLLAATLLPTVWGSALLLALTRAEDVSVAAALARSAWFAVAYAPLALWLGRGLGIVHAVRSWIAAR